MYVPRWLDALLDATRDQAAAKVKVDRLRAKIDEEARRRLEADGAAPQWKARGGVIRLDGTLPEPVIKVADRDAWASYAAQVAPERVAAHLNIAAADVEAALAALKFAGVNVDLVNLDVDGKWETQTLELLDIVVNDPEPGVDLAAEHPAALVVDTAGVVSEAPGMILDRASSGLEAVLPIPSPRLVVTLDPTRKRAAEDAAGDEADKVIAALEGADRFTEDDTRPPMTDAASVAFPGDADADVEASWREEQAAASDAAAEAAQQAQP